MKRFGEVVKEARTSRVWSLSEAARRLGTFKGYVCGIERGALRPPSPRLIKKFAAVYGLSYDDLLARSAVEKLPKGVNLTTVYDHLRSKINATGI